MVAGRVCNDGVSHGIADRVRKDDVLMGLRVKSTMTIVLEYFVDECFFI